MTRHLEDLYRQHAPAILRFAWGLCGDRATAEDLVAETFYRLLVKAPKIETRTALAYLLAITRNTWMSMHLAFGFTGASFATYHSMFKLDRWTGLTCVAMWLVVASGVVGRYLYGRLYSGLGLAEFERKSLDKMSDRFLERWGGEHALSFLGDRLRLAFEGAQGGGSGVTLMLWQNLSDAVRFWWMKRFGLRQIRDPVARRQLVRLMADWRRTSRSIQNLERIKRTLSYWNKVHLVLTLIMVSLAVTHIVYGLLYKAY